MSIRLGMARPRMPRALRCSLLAALLISGLTSGATLAAATPAAARAPQAAPARHVVIVGLSGLRWSDLSPTATPTLWRLAGQGSVGSLVDFAVLPLTCPADGWLILNSGARAESDHTDAGCRTFPAVRQAGAGATVAALPGLIAYNQRFHNDPSWGLLGRAAGCATAVGPGGALALAGPSGAVASYLPSPADLTAGVLSRCPLTVVDLGNLDLAERSVALAAADTELKHLLAELPAATTLLITAPGATTRPPHLQLTLVDGTGYQAGLLESASTRQPGLVVLTDLTPTVLGWLGQRVPSEAVGARLTRGNRGPLPATVRGLTARDTAEQVWRSTHNEFFWAYALADAGVLAAIGLAFWGAAPERRRRRAQWWRVAGVFAVSVPAGTFLANLVPWPRQAHPAAWLYGAAVALALVIGLAALAATRRRDPLAPFGLVCLFTVAVLGLDVMTGSRLQLETPFGLSMVEAGRFYGIGNEALGIYGVTALFGAGWLALGFLQRYPASPRPALAAVAAVATFAVFASGWPGFGGKVGGTITMVPCFALLLMAVAGLRLSWRRLVLAAISGLALFVVFALVSYFTAVTGKSDIGTFAGNALHGNAGGLLLRKIGSNLGSLSVNMFSPLIPIVVVVTGLMLWRPAWFGLKTMPLAYAAEPLLRPVLAVLWLMPVLGWFADDSGVIVPAAALPLALPLGIAALAAVAYRYRSSQGSEQEGPSAVPAIADSCRPVPAHDLAAEGDRRGEHPGVGWRDPGR
ncbi:MAG TPA: hypothetical protein VJ418_15550 [Streptosporangiaceae bacterium]|nr:hypothetical protein [Streptosporangiaceae bacterium]